MLARETFLQIIEHTPLVSIDLLIQRSDGFILLGKRVNKPAQGSWFVPGGRIVKNETIAAAFQRICMAELGLALTVDKAQLLNCYDHIYQDNFAGIPGINTHYVVMAYCVQLDDSVESLLGDNQHEALVWWDLANALKSDQVHENTKTYCQDLLSIKK